MKLTGALLAILAIVSTGTGPDSAVRFEPDGVRVGDELVTGAAFVVKNAILVSGSAVEPLDREISVDLAENRSLVLEPGVRVRRDGRALKLVTHAGRPLAIRGAVIPAPASLAVDDAGWIVHGRRFEGTELRVALAAADASSRTGARPAAAAPDAPPPGGQRRSWSDNPRTLPEGADSNVLRFLSKVSPSGF